MSGTLYSWVPAGDTLAFEVRASVLGHTQVVYAETAITTTGQLPFTAQLDDALYDPPHLVRLDIVASSLNGSRVGIGFEGALLSK